MAMPANRMRSWMRVSIDSQRKARASSSVMSTSIWDTLALSSRMAIAHGKAHWPTFGQVLDLGIENVRDKVSREGISRGRLVRLDDLAYAVSSSCSSRSRPRDRPSL